MRDRDDFRSRFETRNQTSSAVKTIASAGEVDRAIAKLVLAFGTDPVARWMYENPHDYLLHIPRLFRALGKARLKQGRRNAPATAMVSRFGFRWAFAVTRVRSRRSLQKALLARNRSMSATSSR